MMRSKQSGLWAAAVLAIAVGLLPAPALAAQSSMAAVHVGPLGIDFQPFVAYEKLTVTVSGPDGVTLRREFAAGASAVLEAIGTDGKPLPDGDYTYELVASPRLDRETRRALAAARRNGDDSAVAKLRAAGKLPSTPMIQSGSFRIAGGTLVQDNATEPQSGNAQTKAAPKPVTAADQVIPDDLIVQGSECVGLDCVNNENFGFDTIRLKENNLRIHFDDTSTQAGFPANDWRLIANDSASGGSSKFSIEDSTSAKTPFTITAGAATNSIFADSTGRIGLRTSTPVLDLHINTSNTPAIRLEQNNSGGFTAQTWDIGANEANFFVRDVTGGSKLSFRIRPGAPTSSVDIGADGQVGIGTASPSKKLHVFVDDAGDGILIDGDGVSTDVAANLNIQGDSTSMIWTDLAGTANQKILQQLLNGQQYQVRGLTDALAESTTAPGIVLSLANGNVGINCNSSPGADLVVDSGAACNAGTRSELNAGDVQFTNPSSRSFKENLAPVKVEGILDKMSQIQVYSYDFIKGPKDRIGLMAEDFHTIFGRGSDKMINGGEVQIALWLAVQELSAQNKELRRELEELKSKQ